MVTPGSMYFTHIFLQERSVVLSFFLVHFFSVNLLKVSLGIRSKVKQVRFQVENKKKTSQQSIKHHTTILLPCSDFYMYLPMLTKSCNLQLLRINCAKWPRTNNKPCSKMVNNYSNLCCLLQLTFLEQEKAAGVWFFWDVWSLLEKR